MQEYVAADPDLRIAAEQHRRVIRGLRGTSGHTTRGGRDTATQLLSNHAQCTLESVAEWFGVGVRQVKRARVHAAMFGRGVPALVAKQAGHYLGSSPERDVPRFSRTTMQGDLVEVHAACLCVWDCCCHGKVSLASASGPGEYPWKVHPCLGRDGP